MVKLTIEISDELEKELKSLTYEKVGLNKILEEALKEYVMMHRED